MQLCSLSWTQMQWKPAGEQQSHPLHPEASLTYRSTCAERREQLSVHAAVAFKRPYLTRNSRTRFRIFRSFMSTVVLQFILIVSTTFIVAVLFTHTGYSFVPTGGSEGEQPHQQPASREKKGSG